MAINQHGSGTARTCVVDRFEAKDLGAPFKIILKDAVRVTFSETGEQLSYSIPDLEGLIRAVAIRRVLHPRKFSGADIKFLRKAIGVKQKELAQKIAMTHEHLSRCENDSLVLSPTAERLMRVFGIKAALKLYEVKSCKAKTRLEDALDSLFDDIKPVPMSLVGEELEFSFCRCVEDDMSQEPEAPGEWDSDKEAA